MSLFSDACAARAARQPREVEAGTAFIDAIFDMPEGADRVAKVNAYAIEYPQQGYDTHIREMTAARLVVRRYRSCD